MQRMWWVCSTLLLLIGFVPAVVAQNGTAHIRVLHAAQQVPAVDIFVNSKPVLNNSSFLQASSYLDVPAGTHTVAIMPSGSSVADALATTQVHAVAGQFYTLIVAENSNNTVEAHAFADDLSSLATGKARVRFIHMSPDAPGADIEVINGPVLFQNIGFGEASDYQTVDAGTYNVRAVTNGTNTAFTQLSNVEVQAGVVYDIVAAGRLADLQVKILTANPPVQTSEMSPQRMPASGAGDSSLFDQRGMLVLCAGLWLAGGLFLRRASARNRQ